MHFEDPSQPSPEQKLHLIDIFSPEIEGLFRGDGVLYKRKREPLRRARQATKPIIIETHLPSGLVETTLEAKKGDWIITGSVGEEFVVLEDTFDTLYESLDDGTYLPREKTILALKNPSGASIEIRTSWGTQIGDKGCLLVVTLNDGNTFTSDRYLIGSEELLRNNYEALEV